MKSVSNSGSVRVCYVLGLTLFLSVVASVDASQINWRGLADRDHQTSTGQPLPENFVFELGSFAEGFAPSADNTASWAKHWSFIDRTPYQASRRLFTSTVVISSNAAPFSIGRPAYIWGYQVDSEQSEWILLRRSNWTWPSPSQNALPVSWIVSLTGTETILGSISEDIYLTTSSVDPQALLPSLSPKSWLAQHFSPTERDDPAVSSWDADPDGDTISNKLEYAQATDPRKESGSVVAPLKLSFNHSLEEVTVTLTKHPRRLVSYMIEYSTDSMSWREISEHSLGQVALDMPTESRVDIFARELEREYYRVSVSWLLAP